MDRTAKHKVIGFTLRYTNYLTGKNYRAGQWRIMPGQEFAPERLRPVENLHEPDPRNALTTWCDTTTGFARHLHAQYLHEAVVGFSLDPVVTLPSDCVPPANSLESPQGARRCQQLHR